MNIVIRPLFLLRCEISEQSIFKNPKKRANIKNLSANSFIGKNISGKKYPIIPKINKTMPKLFSIIFCIDFLDYLLLLSTLELIMFLRGGLGRFFLVVFRVLFQKICL